MKKLLIIAILACFSGASNAREPTGNELYQMCESDETQLTCAYYISGVLHGAEATVFMVGMEEGLTYEESYYRYSKICFPPGTSGEQTMDIVIKYLSDKPEDRHILASALILKAVRAVFPCE